MIDLIVTLKGNEKTVAMRAENETDLMRKHQLDRIRVSGGTADDNRIEQSHQEVVNANGERGLDERR